MSSATTPTPATPTDDAAKPAREKYPGGECWSVWYYYDFERFERSARRLRSRQECLAWLRKLAELNAEDKYRRVVADRLGELR